MSRKKTRDWWQRGFFDRLMGEILFDGRQKIAKTEVDTILKRIHLPKGARILDLACGTGRHAILFAECGYDVVGLDYSEEFIRQARRDPRAKKLRNLEFIQGDMRKIGQTFAPGSFDLVINLWNSFGYFKTRREDDQVLKGVQKVLKSKGKFLVNTVQLEGAITRGLTNQVRYVDELKSDLFLVQISQLKKREQEIESTWLVVDARKKPISTVRREFRQNVYSHTQMKKKLTAAGLRPIRAWGPLTGDRLTKKSWHQSVVAQKI